MGLAPQIVVSWFLETWLFFLPATLVPTLLYFLWIVFGQDSVLPTDLNLTINNRRIVGSGRGLWGPMVAILSGAFCAIVQGRGDEALVLALGAYVGTLLNSMLKRALGKPRSTRFIPLDNLDFVLGASLFYHQQYGLSACLFVSGLIVCGGSHYWLGGSLRRQLRKREPGAS